VPDEGGVDVTFERGPPGRFELVVGADGLHSCVRRLAFAAEESVTRHQGLYVATMPLPGLKDPGTDVVMFNAPGRSATIHPSRGKAIGAFIFWSPEVPGLARASREEHERVLEEVYGRDGWRVPELLAAGRAADDLYFDSVSRVEMDAWSKGRIVLLGDAASCVSLLGDGSTLAIVGAHTLAGAIAEQPSDLLGALNAYERAHRQLVEPRMKRMTFAAGMLVPETQAGVMLRNLALCLWPLAAGANRLIKKGDMLLFRG
jgi:2-polyprenyl-6-methoxyphenol hydroxylase-like FAD-dependent oxidoreductase